MPLKVKDKCVKNIYIKKSHILKFLDFLLINSKINKFQNTLINLMKFKEVDSKLVILEHVYPPSPTPPTTHTQFFPTLLFLQQPPFTQKPHCRPTAPPLFSLVWPNTFFQAPTLGTFAVLSLSTLHHHHLNLPPDEHLRFFFATLWIQTISQSKQLCEHR